MVDIHKTTTDGLFTVRITTANREAGEGLTKLEMIMGLKELSEILITASEVAMRIAVEVSQFQR